MPLQSLTAFLDSNTPSRNPEILRGVAARNRDQGFRKIRERGGDPLKEHWVINIGASSVQFQQDRVPCITRGVGGGRRLYLSWLGRRLSVREMVRLQGADADRILESGLSEPQIGQVAGNAVPAILLALVIQRLFQSAGLLD